MRIGICVIIALLLMGSPPRAAGIDCGHAASNADKAVCGSPALRSMDAELNRLYWIVREATAPTPRSALIAGERKWVSDRDHNCTDVACLTQRLRERVAVLGALAARVSDANPTLQDLTAVWLIGNWRIGPTVPADWQPASDLPAADGTLTFRSGEICEAGKCASFGLEPQKLADGPGREGLAKALGVAADTPFYLAYINGKAAYGLVPTPSGKLLAVTPGCAPSGSPCGPIHQAWRAKGATATLVRGSAAP